MTGDEDGGDRVIGGRPVRSALHLFWRFSRGLTLGVRVAILDGEERVFLIRHTYAPGWHLPGGAVDPGETVEAAVIRELFEETAVIPAARPRLHGLMLNLHLGARDHVAVYVVDRFTQGTPRVPNREIAEIGFFPPEALPEATSPATRRRIAEVLTGAPAATLW